MRTGEFLAHGAWERNPCKLKRDKASAMPLVFPGTRTAEKVKLRQNGTLSKVRSKCIMFGSFEVRELRIWTTTSISTWNRIRLRDQRGLQTWAAKTTGKSYLWAIDRGSWRGDHRPFNHSLSINTPKPITPDASEQTAKSGSGSRFGKRKNDIPFHWPKNATHPAKSFLNSTLRWIVWESLQTQDNRSIILQRKVQSGHTTMQAWCSRPINDWSYLFLQHLWADHWERTSWIDENVSVGRHAIWATVSINSIPRTTIQEAGPRYFGGCEGRPNLATTETATWRLDAQMEELAAAAKIKSSK